MLAVADHQRARAGKIAQGVENAFGAELLHDGDDDRERGEDREDDGFERLAEEQVDRAADEQQ